jgi:hypothetical protein
LLFDLNKVTDIMRSSAAESFRVRAEYYETQPDFITERLEEVLDETVTATLGLAPLRLMLGSRYKEAIPAIGKAIRAELQAILETRPKARNLALEGNFYTPVAATAQSTKPEGVDKQVGTPELATPASADQAGAGTGVMKHEPNSEQLPAVLFSKTPLRIPEITTAAPFHTGQHEYPHVCARWSSVQKMWTLHDYARDDQGKPDLSQAIPASPEALELLRQAATLSVGRLRESRDPEVRAAAGTLRYPLNIWLGLMRIKERGFRRIPELTRWRGGKSMEAFLESGTLPSDARLTENGTINHIFQKSSAFWDDPVALGFDSETGVAMVPKQPADALPSPEPPAEPNGPQAPEPRVSNQPLSARDEQVHRIIGEENFRTLPIRKGWGTDA